MNIIIGQESVNISAADVLLVEVEHCNIGVVLEYHTGNNLIANLKRLARAVLFNVLAHLHNLARALVTENYRDKRERVILVFVSIGTANTASLNLYKNIVITEFGNGIFLNLEML